MVVRKEFEATVQQYAGPSFVLIGGSFPDDPLMPDLEDTAEVQNTSIFGCAYDDDDLGTLTIPFLKFGFLVVKTQPSTPMEIPIRLYKQINDGEDVDGQFIRSMISLTFIMGLLDMDLMEFHMVYLVISSSNINNDYLSLILVGARNKHLRVKVQQHPLNNPTIINFTTKLFRPPPVFHEPQTEAHIEQLLPSLTTYQRKRKTQTRRKTTKDTKLPQTSVPQDLEADEVVHKEGGDSMERAITTAASLDAAQDSDNIIRTQTTTMPNVDIPQGMDTGGSSRRQDTMRGCSCLD
ncbi:hypothetical protein Tco_0507441 [Tanacetum coccineum]